MPELPDILLYIHALGPRVVGRRIETIRLVAPFLLRSVGTPISAAQGRRVVALERMGKRVVFALEGDVYLVVHLMIAGRFRWKPAGAAVPGKVGLLALDFEHGTLVLTEAGSTRRASLHVVSGEDALRALDPGGLEVLDADREAFSAALRQENHTLKRAMTDPHVLSGIGNAYSDEILHAARLSPFKQTQSLTDEEMARLFDATRATLLEWTRRLQDEAGGEFPGEGHGLPPGHGGARPLSAAVPGVRHAGAAHRLRRQRGQLLRHLPDRRPAARRSVAVAPPQGGLAAHARGTGAAPHALVVALSRAAAYHLLLCPPELTPDPVTFGLVIALAVAGALGVGAQQPELRYGGDAEGGAPFMEADPRNPSQVVGFEVDIAELLARALGRAPRFVQSAFITLDATAARGDFDIGLSGVEDTAVRRSRLAVTVPYYEFREVMTVREADAPRFRTLADLAGRRVGTLGSTLAFDILQQAEQDARPRGRALRERRAPLQRPGARPPGRGGAGRGAGRTRRQRATPASSTPPRP